MKLYFTVALIVTPDAVTVLLDLCSTLSIPVFVITTIVEAGLPTASLKLSQGTLRYDINPASYYYDARAATDGLLAALTIVQPLQDILTVNI